MSFAGHVFDMIRRNKEQRETLEHLRERTREARKKYIGNGQDPKIPEISLEELLKIERLLKNKEKEERFFQFRVTVLIISIGIILILLVIKILCT